MSDSTDEGHGSEATSSHERKRRTIQSEHTSYLHGVSTGWSTMQLQMLHCRSSIATNVGRNLDGCSGIEDFIEFGASHMIRVVKERGRPRFIFVFFGLPPVVFFFKKQHTLQLEQGSTCAVHSNTSKVEQTASEYCPAFVWQDWQNLFG